MTAQKSHSLSPTMERKTAPRARTKPRGNSCQCTHVTTERRWSLNGSMMNTMIAMTVPMSRLTTLMNSPTLPVMTAAPYLSVRPTMAMMTVQTLKMSRSSKTWKSPPLSAPLATKSISQKSMTEPKIAQVPMTNLRTTPSPNLKCPPTPANSVVKPLRCPR